MTGKKYLFVDLEFCNGCRTCEVACKQEHNIPVGMKRIDCIKLGPKRAGDTLRMDYVPMRCMNCPSAPCIKVCPVKAITRRPDGIVLMNPDLCLGETCKKCINSCGLGVIQINPEKNVAEKCDMCVDRVDAGLLPACIEVCPSKCMYYGEINGLLENAITRLYYFTLLPDFTESRGMRRWQKGDPIGRRLHRLFFGLVRKIL